jgi:predicted dehydrogenase
VALVGAKGYGAVHLANIERLAAAQRLRFVACADVAAPSPQLLADLDSQGASFHADYEEMVDRGDIDVVVIATPPHLHAPMARRSMEAGAHVLLEKPPVVTEGQWADLVALARSTGRYGQVGFQSLGSGALHPMIRASRSGLIGKPGQVSVSGQWTRSESYYRRAAWAGKRSLGGVLIRDGVLNNPFAHAVINGLMVAGSDGSPADVETLEAERFRAHDIEVDDTAVLRLSLRDGGRCSVAVTLCAEKVSDPVVRVEGTEGWLSWSYRGDTLTVQPPNSEPRQQRYERKDLLEDLLEVIADVREDLICPLGRVGAFLRVVELLDRIDPRPVPASAVARSGPPEDQRLEIQGVNRAVTDAAREGRLFSELGVSWAT